MERMNFRKQLTILIVQMGNFYSYAWESSIRLDWLRGDRHRLPVAPCQSKLTSLGIARWQTVFCYQCCAQ